MRSAFFGFHVASTALFTARANLNVIGHNVANAEIDGFSRQVAQARANNPLDLRDGRGMYGTGSQITGVVQMRNQFLDRQFWGQRSIQGQHTAVNTHLTFVETVFNNLPGAGVLTTFNNFFARVHDASADASDATVRTNAITEANTLAEMVQHHAQTLHRQQRDLNREVADTVTIINSLGSQIANLNTQINAFERDGSNANDLRDQRNLLIDELSLHVNVRVDERDFSTAMTPNDRRFTVMINGYDFVSHASVSRLEVVQRTEAERRNEMDVAGLYDIRFSGSLMRFNIHSPTLQGTLRGLIDVRDGNNTDITEGTVVTLPPTGFDPTRPQDWVVWGAGRSAATFDSADPATWPEGTIIGPGATTNFKGIPFYMNQLNNLVRTFARAMNEGRNTNGELMPGVVGHIFGYSPQQGADGIAHGNMLFTFNNAAGVTQDVNSLRLWINQDGSTSTTYNAATVARDSEGRALFTLDYSQMNALNFMVNPAINHDPMLLATSSSSNRGESNNDVLKGFIAINNDRTLFREGRLADFIIATSNHLAVDAGQARRFEISYTEISTKTHNHRLSIKGVSIDEEMMNMVRFQTMFQAASRMINVMDSVYETLIMRLGGAGR